MPSVQLSRTRSKRRHRVAVIALVTLFAVSACGARTERQPTPDSQGRTAVSFLYPATVGELLAAIAKAGLPVPNPRDVTARDCPHAGCRVKIETDTVSIMKFPAPGRAELYAGSTHDCFQIVDVVVSFPPSVPTSQRPAYHGAVKSAIE